MISFPTRRLSFLETAVLCAAMLAGCATPGDRRDRQVAPIDVLRPVACAVHHLSAGGLHCFDGRDDAGAFVFVAVPERWNGVLVLHAHGGPFLGAPTMARVDEDVVRWAVVPKAGYAWAATSYRQGGVAVRSAAADVERLRTLALAILPGKPRAVVLHGQSWGGNVAAKEAKIATDRGLYDGVLLTSGVLAGGPRAYEHRFDLRVVYEYLCGNHPRPDEPSYPLWRGLPDGSTMTRADLEARADACLGTAHDPSSRTAEQAARLHRLAAIVRIPESAVVNELVFATFTFADLGRRYGASVFGNVGAVYRSDPDDAALDAVLNADVVRQAADRQALAAFAFDADLAGDIRQPVLTMHATRDPVAFVEMESRFRDTMAAAGQADHLVQTFSDDAVHSYVSDATYVALLDALVHWIVDGTKPTPVSVAASCERFAATFPSTCRFTPDYRPAALESRVTERSR